jgi:hypothetical protein
MNEKADGPTRDEFWLSSGLKRNMSGLDRFTPAPPPLEQIQGRLRPGRVSWGGDPGREPARRNTRPRRPLGAALVVTAISLSAALVFGPGIRFSSVPPQASSRIASYSTLLDAGVETIVRASWSPKGTYVAVVLGGTDKGDNVRILRPDGTSVDAFAASDLGWLDDTTYVGLRMDTNGPASEVHAFVGHIASSARTELPVAHSPLSCGLLAGPTGPVALMTEPDTCEKYVIATAGGVSSVRPGWPRAISRDGTLLAVMHNPAPFLGEGRTFPPSGPAVKPTLEVVRTSTGASVRIQGDLSWSPNVSVAFSPDGKRLAFQTRAPERDSGAAEAILEIATGRVSILGPGIGEFVGWLADDRILVRSYTPGAPVPGGIGVTALDTGDEYPDVWAVAAGGHVAAGKARDLTSQTKTLTVWLGAERETLTLPGYPGDLAWSPDGSALLTLCHNDTDEPNMGLAHQLLLVRP